MNKPLLSVIIITKNEQDNIKDCLESVKWADEIIVVDSHSSDQTEQICKEYTDKFYVKDWHGFGIQKQLALELASHQWVLSIDADERITLELKNELIATLNTNINININGYLIPRLSHYLKKNIQHTDWYPDYNLRLVKKQNAHFTLDIVHERMIVDGRTKKLSNHFLHYPYKNITHHIDKINTYSTLSAKKMFSEGRRISWVMIILKILFGFFRSYVLKRGFLDGWQGLVVSISISLTIYLKYLKLRELCLQKNQKR